MESQRIQVTLISRLGKRRIMNEAKLAEAISSSYQNKIELAIVHFELLTFAEQVEAMRLREATMTHH